MEIKRILRRNKENSTEKYRGFYTEMRNIERCIEKCKELHGEM